VSGVRASKALPCMRRFVVGNRWRGQLQVFALRSPTNAVRPDSEAVLRVGALNDSRPSVAWRGLFAGLAVLVLWMLAPSHADAARRQLTVQEQYELGLKQMKRGYYVKALEQFNRIRNYHRDDPLAVKAELAIADVHYKKHEWDLARDAYEDFLRWHPRYPDADYVVFRLGMAMYKKSNRVAARDQTWTVRAADAWTGFGGRFAESEFTPEVDEKLQDCRERLGRKELLVAEFYRRRKAWVAVERRASGILANHATTESLAPGMGLLAEARAWQGAESEAAALLEKLEGLDAREAARARRRVQRAKPEVPVSGS